MAARLFVVAGLAIAAVIGSTFIGKETQYSKNEYFEKLKLGFTSTGFTMQSVQRQWEVDRNRITVLYYEKYARKWIKVKHLPLYAPKSLYKILLASSSQVGAAFAYEKVVEDNPDLTITHPSANEYPLRLWIKDNSLKYEIYFRAIDSNTMIALKLIKVYLVIEWNSFDITKISVFQQKVLYPDK